MRTFSTMGLTGAVAASTLLLATSTVVLAQSRTIEGDSVTMTVTIEAIEQSTRTLTVKDAEGIYETIVVPPAITKFPEFKVGDRITARYYENVVVRLKRPDEPAVDVASGAISRGTGTATAAGTAAAQRTMTVTVTAMEPKTSTVTVNGPNGYKYSRRVADKKTFAGLKVGDRLDMTWTDALLIAVEPPKK